MRRLISTLDCHPPLTIAMTPAPFGRVGRWTSNVSARPSLCPYTTSVITDGWRDGSGALARPGADGAHAHVRRAASTTNERERLLIRIPIPLRLPNDFEVAPPCSFANGPSGRGLERPSVSGKRTVVPPDGCRDPPRAAIAREQHAPLGFERAPVPRSAVHVEIHGPAARNHGRPSGVGHAAASSRDHEHGPVHKPQPQLVDSILSQLLALPLRREKFYAAVLGGSACGVVRWLNGEGIHQQEAEVVAATERSVPPRRCLIEQQTVRRPGHIGKGTDEALPFISSCPCQRNERVRGCVGPR